MRLPACLLALCLTGVGACTPAEDPQRLDGTTPAAMADAARLWMAAHPDGPPLGWAVAVLAADCLQPDETARMACVDDVWMSLRGQRVPDIVARARVAADARRAAGTLPEHLQAPE
jgi:hypothetical protein